MNGKEIIAVVGSGTMGNGIAHISALSGYSVYLVDINNKFLDKAMSIIAKNLQKQVDKGVISESKKNSALDSINTTIDISNIKGADLVIEAAPENQDIKNKIFSELDSILGSGKEGRVTKNDILSHIKNRGKAEEVKSTSVNVVAPVKKQEIKKPVKTALTLHEGDEVVAMSRMRKLISGHMINSLETSAHVQSFVECDVTNVWNWRAKVKDAFQKREGEKLTFTPIFMEAVAHALKKYPGMNVSVDGDTIINRKNINLGMAAALPDGNLIVPVIKNADQLNLVGMAKAVNSLAVKARSGKLSPDDIQGGTYTVTNVGNFGSIMGTPIINQPEVGILALGSIRKTPSVIETPEGDFIGIRMKMFLSHSYDHRVVDGALGGMFAKCVADYLEAWDLNRDF